jgi:hypothetical protein
MQGFTDALSECEKIWNEKYGFAQMTLDGSARAHLINQHWYAFARNIFKEDSGVVFSTDQLQRYVVVDEKVIIRFKLFDGRLCARNYPTEHSVDWSSQIPLQGLPPCARLHYGYRMDITGTKIKDAFITLPQGSINEWVWQTSGEPIDTFGFQMPLPQTGVSEPMVYAYDNYPLGG